MSLDHCLITSRPVAKHRTARPRHAHPPPPPTDRPFLIQFLFLYVVCCVLISPSYSSCEYQNTDTNTLERVLYGARAFVFDPGAHALPELHRRFRRRLCSGAAGSGGSDLDYGVVSGGSDRYGFSGSRSGLREGNHSLKPPTEEEDEGQDNDYGGELVYEEAGVFDDAHPWEEEAPQTQLNGGSDPIVVTATHVVSRSGWRWGSGCSDGGGRGSGVGGAGSVKVRSDGGMGGSSMRTGSAGTLLGDFGSSSGGNAAAGGGGGGVLLRIRAYNATNARLHGFIIRLSFGQGAEAAGMGDGGKVEAHVDEVRIKGYVCSWWHLDGFRFVREEQYHSTSF